MAYRLGMIISICLISILWAAAPANDRQAEPYRLGCLAEQDLPGHTPKLYAPGTISTVLTSHSSPAFSPGGREVYWSAYQNYWMDQKIYFMSHNGQEWSEPAMPVFSGTYNDGNPVFSADGRTLYFNSVRAVDEESGQGINDVWFVTRDQAGWSEPTCVGLAGPDVRISNQVSLSDDRYLYFASVRDGSHGGADIYRIRADSAASGIPENLGESINGPTQDVQPFVAPDGSYLLFVSLKREDCLGKTDLYISFRDEQGAWSKAKNLGPQFNTVEDEGFPRVSRDGRYLFFTRAGNVYWVDASVIDDLRPD